MQQTRIHNLAAMAVPACSLMPLRGECRPSCFSMAENYYEHIYCEIQARDRGGELPPFADFRDNEPLTQALLLQRPATRLGIEVARPDAAHGNPDTRAGTTSAPSPVMSSGAASHRAELSTGLTGCQFDGAVIRCADGNCQLTGNRGNRHLAPGALDAGNRLNLGQLINNPGERDALSGYLTSYARCLYKMLAIGLGAVTLSYRKFQFIHEDVTAGGADFGARFETMYMFLKKDKQNMDANGVAPKPGNLHLADCDLFAGGVIACEGGARNYLFVKTDDPMSSVSRQALQPVSQKEAQQEL